MIPLVICYVHFFVFKQKTAYEMRISDWSSDVCSSDLPVVIGRRAEWARPVRFGEMVAGEQIDEVEIRRVGQRPAPEPAQREDDKLAVRNAAMRRHEFGDSRLGEQLPRRLERKSVV